MKILDDKTLIEIYKKAVELNINKDFLHIIVTEITGRGLSFDTEIDSWVNNLLSISSVEW